MKIAVGMVAGGIVVVHTAGADMVEAGKIVFVVDTGEGMCAVVQAWGSVGVGQCN